MKDLYLKTLGLIKTVPSIKFADLDKGQLDNYEVRPALIFPCVLIRLEFPKTENIGAKQQKVQAQITLRVAFDFVGRTASNTPEPVVEQSLGYFDTMTDLYKAFQDYYGDGFTRFSRISLREEKRNDGLKVVNMPFITNLIDKSAV